MMFIDRLVDQSGATNTLAIRSVSLTINACCDFVACVFACDRAYVVTCRDSQVFGSRAYVRESNVELLRGLGTAGGLCSTPPQSSWCWEPILLVTYPCFRFECMSGLYLYEGRCEANCPPRTYPGINAKERAACIPCHYTCLTCAGETDAHCLTCHDEATPVPSGLTEEIPDPKKLSQVESMSDGVKTVDLQDVQADDAHLSWGKRDAPLKTSVLRKKAVTKKILEQYTPPRTLFFCYPTKVMEEFKANEWYRRMAALFSANLIILAGILLYFVCSKYCLKKKPPHDEVRFRYSKMNNGKSRPADIRENILYVSSSTDEE